MTATAVTQRARIAASVLLAAVLAGALRPPAALAGVGCEDKVADGVVFEGAPDLSFLNAADRPAGRHGFLHARGEQLVFDDGTIARLWGTNITAAALFGSSHEAVREQARRLARMGFNLVRIHHHDSAWVKPNIFGPPQPHDTQHLDPAMLDRLDWWIKCLRDEGIYVWLDLHVGRQLRAGDGIAAFDEIAKGKSGAELRGYNYIDAGIRRAMQRFNEAYLGHVNAYTGRAYKDEPAIAAVLITNENDVTHHFGNALLPDKGVPRISAAYLRAARAFAQAHDLPADRVWRSWQPGPAKLFLNDLEHRFNAAMIAHLRAFGVKVPIATTSLWGDDPLSSLPALTDGDVIDVHAYDSPGVIERDPRVAGSAIHTIASGQIAGKPLTVTEWNMSPFPGRDRQVLPLFLAAHADQQGWDALMQYAWVQTPAQHPGPPSNWQACDDPSLLAALPAAALLFRQGHVRQDEVVRVLAPSAARLLDSNLQPGATPAMRVAAEQGRLVTVLPPLPALPWLQRASAPADAQRIDIDAPLADKDIGTLRSASGELERDWRRGVFTIDTPRTQAALGRLGGRSIAMEQVRIALSTAHASVAVQSLDGAPLGRSRDVLVSVATPSAPAGPGRGPYVAEPAAGIIEVKGPAGLALHGGSDDGVHLDWHDGTYTLHLEGKRLRPWLHLTARADS